MCSSHPDKRELYKISAFCFDHGHKCKCYKQCNTFAALKCPSALRPVALHAKTFSSFVSSNFIK